jgi:hypothetical protein
MEVSGPDAGHVTGASRALEEGYQILSGVQWFRGLLHD